jgi:hypothetical protein
MRLPRLRLTVRRMMIVVAVVAAIEDPNSAGPDELTRLSRLWSARHAALRRKYEHAEARPWEYVPPDPPDPVPLSGPGRRVDLHFEP